MKQGSDYRMLLFPLFLALFELAVYLSNDMYLPALPSLKDEFNTTNSLAQLSLTAWFMGATIFHLIIGPMSDRLGRKPVLLAVGVIFIVSLGVCASTGDIYTLLAARFFQGTAVSAVAVASYASVHELLDDKKAIKTIAWMTAISIIAPAFGPLFGAGLISLVGWRSIFSLLAYWAFVVLIALYFILPESNPRENRKALTIGSILSNYMGLIKNRGYAINTLAASLIFGGTIVWIAAGPFLVIEKFGYSPTNFGLIQVFIFSGFMVGAILVKVASSKYATNTLVNIGLTIGAISSAFALLTSNLYPNSLVVLTICLFGYSIGNGVSFATLQRLAIISSEAPTGAKMAVFATSVAGFATLASILVSAFYNGETSFFGEFMIAFSIIALLIRLGLPVNIPLTTVEASEK